MLLIEQGALVNRVDRAGAIRYVLRVIQRETGRGVLPMAGIDLRLDELLLDLENPRISRAGSQREALQKIIEDQDVKLVVLAESIVSDGLNPMDRWLVLKAPLSAVNTSSLKATAGWPRFGF